MDSHEQMGVKLTVWCTLVLLSLPVSASDGEINIRAHAGQTVILPCGSLYDDSVMYVKWTRTDLKTKYVFLYTENRHLIRHDRDDQHPSFESRVEMKDKQRMDGDVILKNVKIEDTGTYKCRYMYPLGGWIRSPFLGSPDVHLTVTNSGCGPVNIRPTDANAKTSTVVNSDKGGEAGHTEDRGDKDVEAKIGADYILRNKTRWNTFGRGRDAVNRHGAVRLAVSVLVIYLLVVFAVGCCFVMYRQSKLNSYRPPHGKALVYQWT